MTPNEKLQQLLAKENWTDEDRNWLLQYLEKTDTSELRQLMLDQFSTDVVSADQLPAHLSKQLLQKIHQRIEPVPAKVLSIKTWKRVAAAAIVIGLSLGTYLIFFKPGQKSAIAVSGKQTHDISAPNIARATLKLNDGTIVYLDSVQNGSIAIQGNVKIVKLADGQIAYQSTTQKEQTVQYNTVSNPRGSIVQNLTLSDGTKVWLNSESSIKYPVSFFGNERKVEITGEAYFEVAKDATKKFIVDANGVNTEVLGTHFNVNSYSDEPNIKVTLLEGSVKISKENFIGFLKPGQQAQAFRQNAGSIKIVNDVDLDEVIAWKNGRFQFSGAGIEEVMRQIGRWYDVEVVYEGKPKEQHFRGGISRNVEASKVFKMLETTEAIKFKIEGKKVIVMP